MSEMRLCVCVVTDCVTCEGDEADCDEGVLHAV